MTERKQQPCCCGLHAETDKAFEQSLVRFNEIASKAAADSLLNATVQQQSFAAAMLKQTSLLTGNNQ